MIKEIQLELFCIHKANQESIFTVFITVNVDLAHPKVLREAKTLDNKKPAEFNAS